MERMKELKTKIYADGASLEQIRQLRSNPLIGGFTTNPTLMRKAGVSSYAQFAREALTIIDGLPISFEVFADDLEEMEAQALTISQWGKNVFVKVPITNTKGESTLPVVQRLANRGIQCNVTAIFTEEQLVETIDVLNPETPAVLSIFAGRIADTGVDPIPLMAKAVEYSQDKSVSVLWASPREVLNIFQADEVGCDIITLTYDLLDKLSSVGKALSEFSLETVKMFHEDAASAGYEIDNDYQDNQTHVAKKV